MLFKKKLNLLNFNTINVNDMTAMFVGCRSLKVLEINDDFIGKNVFSNQWMFSGCSEELKAEIKNKFKNLSDEAFVYVPI